MSVRCPNCKREYDITLFEFGRKITCECGRVVKPNHQESLNNLNKILKRFEIELEEEKLLMIKRASERIASLILDPEYPKIDIEIEKGKFKGLIKEQFPEKVYLYDLIYEPRFKRLEEQFRT